jgi:acyl-CoA synthetase (NDP forming)
MSTPPPATAADLSVRPVDALFAPRSVAVLGASDDARKWGNWLARGALRGTHRRPTYLVNRRAGTVLGQPAFPSLRELPGPADLVAIAVPASGLDAAVDDALAAGARAIVAITAGSHESPDAAAAQAALAARVRAAGAVLLGPNCLGVMDAGESLKLATADLPAGAIGLISQSGNLALELGLLAERDGLGFSRFASLGNQIDLGATDLLVALAGHEPTRLIALYVEDFGDGRAFARVARAAVDAGKPVVALAIAGGAVTARAVASHTGALASDDAAIDAAFAVAGVHRVHTPRELIDVSSALLRCAPMAGRRVAVLADGGGHGSIAADQAERHGLEVPELSAALQRAIAAGLPDAAAVSNPVDLAGGAEQDVHTFDRIARRLLDSGELDALLVTGYFGGYEEYGPATAAEELRTAAILSEVHAGTRRPLVVHTMYPTGGAASALREAGVPVYATIEQAAAALRALAPPTGRASATATGGIPALPEPAPSIGSAAADNYERARDVLAAGGVPFVASRTVRADAEAALAAAAELGYPVALKALGRLHKSDAGGVVLGLRDPVALRAAHTELGQRLGTQRFSVERMAPIGDGAELLIGARWDPRLGPIALAGAGGVYAELLGDSAVALAPVSPEQARALIASLRIAPLLTGARGRPPLDLAAAADALSALSRVAAAHPELAELEVNPLLVLPSGALALDARFVNREETQWPLPRARSHSRHV